MRKENQENLTLTGHTENKRSKEKTVNNPLNECALIDDRMWTKSDGKRLKGYSEQ